MSLPRTFEAPRMKQPFEPISHWPFSWQPCMGPTGSSVRSSVPSTFDLLTGWPVMCSNAGAAAAKANRNRMNTAEASATRSWSSRLPASDHGLRAIPPDPEATGSAAPTTVPLAASTVANAALRQLDLSLPPRAADTTARSHEIPPTLSPQRAGAYRRREVHTSSIEMMQGPALLQRVGAGHDLEDGLRDLGLPGPVHRQGVALDQVGGVVRGAAHRAHPGAVLGGRRLEQRAVDRRLDRRRQQRRQHLVGVRLEQQEALERDLTRRLLADRRRRQRQQHVGRDLLDERRPERVVDHHHAVDLAGREQLDHAMPDRLGILVARPVGEAGPRLLDLQPAEPDRAG